MSAVLNAAAVLINGKLDSVRKYLVKEYSKDGRVDEDHQYALRVIESGRRELFRYIAIRTLQPDNPVRRQAEIEVSVRNRDHGELFRWRHSNHSVGRLGCRGCDFDFVQDEVLGLPVKVYLSRLCPICGEGIQHCLSVDNRSEALEAVRGFWEAVRVVPVDESLLGALRSDVGGVIFACDSCHGWQFEVISC